MYDKERAMEPALVCVTRIQQQAQQIIDRLRAAGFSAKDTSLLLSDGKEMVKVEGQLESKG